MLDLNQLFLVNLSMGGHNS
ncbi:Hypothetical protein SSCIU_02776 [Mammaliicoccus sciuri]|nr:Hypothetical protein SSCIU_02776 [Mammaliicoccus sciuri]